MDEFLKSFSDKYDKWREEGDFEFSSKVIPVKESLVTQQWVLPSEQVLEILKNARSFALS